MGGGWNSRLNIRAAPAMMAAMKSRIVFLAALVGIASAGLPSCATPTDTNLTTRLAAKTASYAYLRKHPADYPVVVAIADAMTTAAAGNSSDTVQIIVTKFAPDSPDAAFFASTITELFATTAPSAGTAVTLTTIAAGLRAGASPFAIPGK